MRLKRLGPNRTPRPLAMERMETRALLAADLLAMQDMLAMDVDGDLNLSPTDAIGIVNELNANRDPKLHHLDSGDPVARRLHRLDTDRDGFVAANDVLRIINKLNLDGPQDLHLRRIAGDAMAGLSATQQGNLEELYADVNMLRMECEVAPDDVVDLVHDLSRLADGTTPPSPESVGQLSNDLVDAAQDGALSDDEIATLTADVGRVLQEANVSTDDIQIVVADLRNIVESSGVTADDVRRIADHLKNIVGEFAANHEHQVHLGDVRNLLQDVTTIRDGERLTLDRIRELAGDFANVVGEDHTPDPLLMAQLVGDYVLANADDQLSDREVARLTRELYAVLDSAHITPEIWDGVLADMHQVTAQSGADDHLRAVVHDLQALADSFRDHDGSHS